MAAFACPVCDYVYDERAGAPREGFPAGTGWPDIPGGLVLSGLRGAREGGLHPTATG